MIKRMFVCVFPAFLIVLASQAAPAQTELPKTSDLQPGEVIETVADAYQFQLSPEFKNPSFIWIQEILVPIISLIMLVFFIRQSVRAGELTFGALLFISATTMFWQEWYADWGAYLLFNPKFALMPWGSALWTAPNKPWMVILSYGPFFTIIYPLMLWLINKLHTRYPGLGKVGWILIVVIPNFYLWDLVIEGIAASLDWWSYTDYIGPALAMEKGNFPIVYPVVVFVLYGVMAIWMLSLRGPDERVRFESWLGVDRIQAGWRRELARAGSWIGVMNGLFLVFLSGPLVVVREADWECKRVRTIKTCAMLRKGV